MANWRDPVDGRDFELPPRPKDKDNEIIQPNKQSQSNNTSGKFSWLPVLTVLLVFMLCGVLAINIYIASQVNTVIKFVERGFSNPTSASHPTKIPFTPTAISLFAIPSTETSIATLISPTETITPTPMLGNIAGQENFPDTIVRLISLKDGELIVGTAVKFAIRTYGCNTIDSKENTPYTLFLIKGPIDVDIEIYKGSWDYWENVYDDIFAKSLLESKRNEIRKYPNYLVAGHIECIILSSK